MKLEASEIEVVWMPSWWNVKTQVKTQAQTITILAQSSWRTVLEIVIVETVVMEVSSNLWPLLSAILTLLLKSNRTSNPCQTPVWIHYSIVLPWIKGNNNMLNKNSLISLCGKKIMWYSPHLCSRKWTFKESSAIKSHALRTSQRKKVK